MEPYNSGDIHSLVCESFNRSMLQQKDLILIGNSRAGKDQMYCSSFVQDLKKIEFTCYK